MKYCRNCGNELDDNAFVCPKCGVRTDGYVPPQQPQYQPQPASQPVNGLAIAGFVVSFFFSVVGLILSIIGLKKSQTMNDSGKGFAIAGIVLGAIGTVGWLIGIISCSAVACAAASTIPAWY